MEFLKDVYERRRKYFEDLDRYLREIKEIVRQEVPDAEVYLFGSVAEGRYSVGLSDIDIAIVSDELSDRDKRLELFGKLTRRFFDSPFEFHILTREQWEKHKNFVREFRRV